MLVYVRRGRVANMDEEQPTVPPLAAQKLYEMDCELTAEMKRYQAEEVRCGADFERTRNTKRSVYQVWNAESDEDMSLLIDKDALHSWLTAEILPEKKTANVKSNGTSNKGSKQNSSDDSESDCVEVTSKPAITLTPKRPHSSSNGTVNDPPQSPTRVVPSLRKGKERAVETYMDMDETTPKCSKSSSATKPKSTSKSPVKKVPDATTTASCRVDGVADIDATTLSKTAVSVTTETFLPKSLRHVTELDSSNLLCPHNLVRPAMAPQMKRVSQAGIAALIASGVKIAPDLLVPDSLCRQCAFEPVQSKSVQLPPDHLCLDLSKPC